jgi:hypothetical protein
LSKVPFQADIRIVDGADALSVGPGFANVAGLTAKGGGTVHWTDISAMRSLEVRPGNASTGAIAGGAVGLFGGPPVAAVAAVGGAVTALAAGAKSLYAIGLASGGDILIEIGMWKSKKLEKTFAEQRGAQAQIQPAPSLNVKALTTKISARLRKNSE